MKVISKIAYFICAKLVNFCPSFFLKCLSENNFDYLVLNLNKPHLFNWQDINIPNKINGFEDLTFLFWASPLNRGILRQDFDEAALLFRTVNNMSNPIGVEIGRFNGGSTILIAAAVGSKGKLISIDIEPQDDLVLQDIINKLGMKDRVDLITGNSNEIILHDNYDFVFIDGDHSYEGAKRDHNKLGALVKVGGFIIHHDMGKERRYSTQWDELFRLKSDILLNQQKELRFFSEAGSITVFQRISFGWKKI
jgi:hypothetical protein